MLHNNVIALSSLAIKQLTHHIMLSDLDTKSSMISAAEFNQTNFENEQTGLYLMNICYCIYLISGENLKTYHNPYPVDPANKLSLS